MDDAVESGDETLRRVPLHRREFTPPVYLVIFAANLCVLIVTALAPDVRNALAMDPRAVLHGQIWRLFTHAWVHGSLGHFVGNMLLLLPFALILERKHGAALVAGAYATGCVLVGLFLLITWQSAIGASGVVCALAMMAILGLIAPTRKPMWALLPEMLLGVAIAVIWLLPLAWSTLMGLFRGGHISHWGHLGGLLAGFAMYRVWARTTAPKGVLQGDGGASEPLDSTD